ncbi:tektin-like protein 1 [Saccostrea cucullata]|uniref:tektin-like protein 1 n=1 Tax=Saccostrea cuccullata TaxID=36930 RepID=UPI002ED26384
MLGNKAATTIGPESWRNSTLKGIKLSQTIVQKSDKSCDVGRSLDPLPHLRDTVAQLSNDEIHRYTREVRVIVAKLRESLLDTNEEIKALTRGKEALEKALEHTRKDIALNKDSQEVRVSRPARERVLDAARRRLFNVLNERSRVMDLLNHSLSSAGSQSAPTGLGRSRTSMDGRLSRLNDLSGKLGFMSLGQPDPLGPYTPEADQALVDAQEARARSAYLRRELKDAIDRTEKLQKAAHKSVNDGLTQKVAETITLKQHLGVGLGENRHGIHRAQRWYDATDKARGYTMGPVAYSDIATRERLDRPMVKVFQRHPGTQLPEAQEIIRSGDGLLQSLSATSRNIGLLKLSQLRLRNDIKGKAMASSVDGSIIRLRRRKSDHRWTLGEAF